MVGRLPLRAETVTCTEVQIKDRVLRLRTDLLTTCIRLWIAADVTDKKAVPARIGAKSTGPERCRGELHVVIIQLGGQKGSHLGDISYRLVEQFFHPMSHRK